MNSSLLSRNSMTGSPSFTQNTLFDLNVVRESLNEGCHVWQQLPELSIGEIKLNELYNADCIAAMRLLPDRCIDVAIADPPYNASKGNTWKWDNSVDLPGFGGNW